MRREKIILILLGVSVYLFLIIYGIKQVYTAPAIPPAKEMIITEPQEKITIAHTEIFGPLERPQVIFDHKKHVEAIKKEGKKEWETCEVCHRPKKEELVRIKKENEIIKEKKTETRDVLVFVFPKREVKLEKEALKKAYHDECIGCHREKLKEKKKSGPVTCGDCHVKKNEFVKIKYPVVEFDPKFHYDHEIKLKERTGEKDCGLCHHSYDLKEKKLVYQNGTGESCYYCHDFSKKKRSLELSQIVEVTAEKKLSYQKTAHQRCLSCHIKINKEMAADKKGNENIPPLECGKCHTGKYRTIQELEAFPRPDVKQPKQIFITQENATMKEVYFNHAFHEKTHKTCRECHHERLKACKDCHTVIGTKDGNFINSAKAMHDVFSERSCVGCHYSYSRNKKECSGCHSLIKPIDIATLNPKSELCNKCHTGKVEPHISLISEISSDQIKKDVKIELLAKEYKAAEMPHLKIINGLIKTSNQSKLATYFHREKETICLGCHHNTQKTEITEKRVPLCRSCHNVVVSKPNEIKLVAAYHEQCLGCHQRMELKKGVRCTDCHKENPDRPKEIITEKNLWVIKQNREKILNIWHPE